MSELNYLSAVVLGLVQGVTEFLPVSSSGHLVIVQRFLDMDGGSAEMLLFDVAVHVGTLGAVAVVFAKTFLRFGSRLICEMSASFRGRRTGMLIVGLALAATVPTAAIGLFYKDWFERMFSSALPTGIGLMATGTLLWATGRIRRPTLGWRRLGLVRAVGVGLMQGIAILPGVSRSGSTICGAMMLGLKRRWAAEFSFLIAVPAIAGAALVKLWETMQLPAEELSVMSWGPILAGALTAAVSGAFALRALLGVVIRDRIQSFRYYCWGLGLVVIGWSAAT